MAQDKISITAAQQSLEQAQNCLDMLKKVCEVLRFDGDIKVTKQYEKIVFHFASFDGTLRK